MNQAEARQLWLEAIEKIKDRTMKPMLWRAIEAGVGIALDDEFFIVGFPPSEGPMGGYLTSADHKQIIEQVISDLVGKPTRIKVIEGTTMADLEAARERDRVAEITRKSIAERKHVERKAEREWETVAEQCSRKYANTPLRQLPQTRGQYMLEAVKIVSEAMDEIHPDGNIDDVGQRAMGRVIDKVATLADVPGASVALELIKYRNGLGKKTI